MKLQDIKKLSAAEISATVNKETKAFASKGGVVKLVGMLLYALSLLHKSSGSKEKTLTKYADAQKVNTRDIPKQAWCFARVAVELLADEAAPGKVTEADILKASVHTLNAASRALGVLASKVAADEVSAAEAVGFRENIAAAVRANSEADAKGQTDALQAADKAAKDAEKEKAEKMTDADKLLAALVAVAKMTAVTELSAPQLDVLAKWHASYGAQIAERQAVLAKASTDATAKPAKAKVA